MAAQLSDEKLLEQLEATYWEPSEDVYRREWFCEARRRLRDLSGSDRWKKLDPDVVREVLVGDDGAQQQRLSEREIFRIALKWLSENPERAVGHIDRMLGAVRYTAIATEDKFKCLDEAKKVGMQAYVKPYLIEADWYRTCVELNHPEYTDLVEFDRTDESKFVGEGRRTAAIEEQLHTVRSQAHNRCVISIETKPMSLERVEKGRINRGSVMQRLRPECARTFNNEESSTPPPPPVMLPMPEMPLLRSYQQSPPPTGDRVKPNVRTIEPPDQSATAPNANYGRWRDDMYAMAAKNKQLPPLTLPAPSKLAFSVDPGRSIASSSTSTSVDSSDMPKSTSRREKSKRTKKSSRKSKKSQKKK